MNARSSLAAACAADPAAWFDACCGPLGVAGRDAEAFRANEVRADWQASARAKWVP